MTTPSGHTTAILASRVKGTNVYNSDGEKIGHVEDVILDKQSNRIIFAALGFGGFLGIGEKFHPIPWSLLSYNKDKGGYIVPMSTEVLKGAPVSDLKDLTKNDGEYGDLREKSYEYYKVAKDW